MEVVKKRNDKGLKKPKSTNNIVQPAIKPKGTNGSEWQDYAWSANDY